MVAVLITNGGSEKIGLDNYILMTEKRIPWYYLGTQNFLLKCVQIKCQVTLLKMFVYPRSTCLTCLFTFGWC